MKTTRLAKLSDLTRSSNPRAPHADVSNAPHLMGDIYEGGAPLGPYGDADDDDYGDVEDDAYGDVSTSALDSYSTLIGDTADDYTYGAPVRRKKGLSKAAKIGLIGAGVGGAALGIRALIKNAQRRKKQQAAVARSLEINASQSTIANQVTARRLMGKVPRTAAFPFYQLEGATLNGYPLSPTEVFAADTLKYNFDIQSTQTPFEVEIVSGTYAGVTWTLQANGVATDRFYTAVIVTIGISVLTANPGTIFTVTGTFPTINGALTISTNPFSFTIRKGYYAKFLIFPWQLVTNKPLLALGKYSNAAPIIVNITGLPSNATVNMVVPGSQHVWTIGMRNRLL